MADIEATCSTCDKRLKIGISANETEIIERTGMNQQELFREQPTCPGCGSANVVTETATAGKCQRCGWRIRIAADGTASSWLNLGTTAKRLKPVSIK